MRSILAIALAAAAITAGCGDDNDATTGPADTGAAPVATDTPNDDPGRTTPAQTGQE